MMLACTQSRWSADFYSKINNQQFLIDILLKYSGMDMGQLAQALSLTVDALSDIYVEQRGFADDQANHLAQLFLMFLGRRLETCSA